MQHVLNKTTLSQDAGSSLRGVEGQSLWAGSSHMAHGVLVDDYLHSTLITGLQCTWIVRMPVSVKR